MEGVTQNDTHLFQLTFTDGSTQTVKANSRKEAIISGGMNVESCQSVEDEQ